MGNIEYLKHVFNITWRYKNRKRNYILHNIYPSSSICKLLTPYNSVKQWCLFPCRFLNIFQIILLAISNPCCFLLEFFDDYIYTYFIPNHLSLIPPYLSH